MRVRDTGIRSFLGTGVWRGHAHARHLAAAMVAGRCPAVRPAIQQIERTEAHDARDGSAKTRCRSSRSGCTSTIDGEHATTTLLQVYQNNTGAQIEGRYRLRPGIEQSRRWLRVLERRAEDRRRGVREAARAPGLRQRDHAPPRSGPARAGWRGRVRVQGVPDRARTRRSASSCSGRSGSSAAARPCTTARRSRAATPRS